MFDWITHLAGGNPWTYALAFAVAAGDVLLPLLPSETVVITPRRLFRGEQARGRPR